MQIIQAVSVLLLGCVKFFLAIPLAVQYGFSFWQTFLFSCLGGIIGVVFFAKFRKVVLKIYFRIYPFNFNKNKKGGLRKTIAIKTARKYGLFGIAFITPVFLSIPIGTFIALHFFPNKKKTLPILFASVLGWSFLLTLIWI
tara:strand:- start:491 stop:913 length:423 start_codon:yes stop_codon:yes gene_type:complete